MIIMMTSILYLMNLLLAFISNKITPTMFDLDVVIQFRAWRPVLNPSRDQRWRCHHYIIIIITIILNVIIITVADGHTQTYDHDDNLDDDQ